jgi:hypothetical protein
MHPDLFLIVYRQSERELEQRLAHRRAAAERQRQSRPAHVGTPARVTALLNLRPTPAGPVCCPA